MATKLNDKQLLALTRFNRQFNVAEITISNTDDSKIEVHAIVRAGKLLKRRGFYINDSGDLAGVIKYEDSTPLTEHSA